MNNNKEDHVSMLKVRTEKDHITEERTMRWFYDTKLIVNDKRRRSRKAPIRHPWRQYKSRKQTSI